MAKLDGGQWYSVALTSFLATVILRRYVSRLFRVFRKATKHYHELVFLTTGLILFLAGNICLVLINVSDNDDRQKRAATAGAFGLCLILIPGRTNVLAQAAGISINSYYLTHHWVAFIAGGQALGVFVSLLIHILSSIVNYYKILWISGYTLVWAVMFFFRIKPAFSRQHGRVESMTEVQSAAVIRVKLSEEIPMYPVAYYYLCLNNGRFYRLFGLPVVLYSWSSVFGSYPVQLQLPENDRFVNGDTQKNASSSKQPRLQQDKAPTKGGNNEPPRLTQPLKGICAVFGTSHGGDLVTVSQKVFLDGPYGKDIHLEKFKTVTLIAEGCGIFGAFPHAMFLAQHAFHNRDERRKMKDQKDFSRSVDRLYGDVTRKVNLFWILELQAQDRLAARELSQLMSLDEGHALLHVYIMYPKPITGSEDTLRIPEHVKWMRSHGTKEHQYKLLREVLALDSYGADSSAILVSGNTEFTDAIHKFVLQSGIETRVFTSEYPESEDQTNAFRRASKNGNLNPDVEKGNVIRSGVHQPTLVKRRIRVENIRRVP
ncbi:hypothetical protein BDP55DRAFT_756748 [Colletotrichum godetiae]|uniref:Ferric reductase like transmembrane component n=1 Tax=Colletotrichum godetiae TaxID=1209918 RepID=A0AAJ0ESC0_9PEZI|nr:uncharacterized protein BDP55DRAFT_756748 [Colletotrichum godetiae]KAK1659343.1 hypothetical protein BDP55DRAFT_756748 [Colletotrichum godetiae]